MRKSYFWVLMLLLSLSQSVCAAMKREMVRYAVDGIELESVLVGDFSAKKRPALVLIPNWMGINEANLKQAELIAGMGYVVLVADMFGKDVRPKNAAEAGKVSGAVKGDRMLMRRRVNAALVNLQTIAKSKPAAIDAASIGAIGFCFGGTTALELARSGAGIAGAVSFHGGLSSGADYDAKAVKARVLALHGADDPYVPADEVKAFETEMRAGKIDWELISYGNAVHSFTDVDAKAVGQAHYDAKVAARAYARMQQFFQEIFVAKR
jgi:dienelactone hydrolase